MHDYCSFVTYFQNAVKHLSKQKLWRFDLSKKEVTANSISFSLSIIILVNYRYYYRNLLNLFGLIRVSYINYNIILNQASPNANTMTMISQSSFISDASSNHRTNTFMSSSKLQKIESDVFGKIVHLKNEKIQLLTVLSDCIDRKYSMEAQLLHHLEVKNKKEQNLASKDQYRPVIYRNIELKAEAEELQRQLLERTNKSRIAIEMDGSGIGSKSRSKSVFDLSKSKQMNRSNVSRSKKQLMVGSNMERSQVRGSNFELQKDDELIEQILEQRKLNNSLVEIIRQETNTKIERESENLQQQETQNIKNRLKCLTQLIQQKQQSKIRQKLSKTKTVKGSESRASKKSSSQGKGTLMPVTYQSDVKVQIKQLLKYIQQEEEEKKLLYQQLNDFVKEMDDLRDENQEMKRRLESE